LNLLWTNNDGVWSLHKRNKILWGSIEIDKNCNIEINYKDKVFTKKFDSLKVAQNVSMTIVSSLNILNKSKNPDNIELPGDNWSLV